MHVVKAILLTGAAAVVAWGSASAADIYVPVEPAPYIAPEKEWDWTGIHVGIDAGGQFDFVHTSNRLTIVGTGELFSEADMGAQNWFLSGDIGADYQVGDNFVIGIFANYDWSPSDSSASNSVSLVSDAIVCDLGCSIGETRTYGDAWGVGGRAGFLINPKTLVYGLGGYGMKQIDEVDVIDGGGDIYTFAEGGWTPGWFVGAGIEAAMGTHATVAVEYRYAQYSSDEVGSNGSHTIRARVSHWFKSGADIHVSSVEPAPYIAPEKEWDWTGIHVGIDAGGQLDLVHSDAFVDFDAGPDGVDLFDEADLGAQNWFLSGDIGADYQVGDNFVIGIFANYDWSPSDSSASHIGLADDEDEDEPCEFVCEVGNTVTYGDAWGVGGRAGFLINRRTLVYGLGGYGMKQINAESFFEIDGNESADGSLTGGGWQPGWFVGGGIEAAVGTHASVALEYRYAQYSGFSASCNTDVAGCSELDWSWSDGEVEHGFDVGTTSSQTIRARLSLWFN